MVGSSNFESKSIRPKVILKTTTQTSPGLATTDPVFASQCTLLRRPVPFHSYSHGLSNRRATGSRGLLLCSSVGSDRSPDPRHSASVLCLPNVNTIAPLTRWKMVSVWAGGPLPYSTAFRAQMCRGQKTQISRPTPTQNKIWGKGENVKMKKKEKKRKKQNTLMGPFMQIMCSAFLF